MIFHDGMGVPHDDNLCKDDMHDLLHDDIPWNSRWVLHGDDILQLNSGEVPHKNGDKEGLLDDDDYFT